MKKIVLASSSPYRAALLERLFPDFRTDRPDVDETPLAGEAPAALAARLARAKAEAVAPRHPGTLVIGSDQVASVGDAIFGKPGTAARAETTLTHASGREMVFHTAVTVIETDSGQAREAVETFRAGFRALTPEEIRAYVALDTPLDCAGAIRTESRGPLLLNALEGRDPTTMIGLPLIALAELMREFGVNPLVPETPATPGL